MRIRLVYATISRIFTAARLMNAPCKYYFCLCTRQLSATLVLINNAKQTRPGHERGGGGGVRGSGVALWQRDLDDAAASTPIR